MEELQCLEWARTGHLRSYEQSDRSQVISELKNIETALIDQSRRLIKLAVTSRDGSGYWLKTWAERVSKHARAYGPSSGGLALPL